MKGYKYFFILMLLASLTGCHQSYSQFSAQQDAYKKKDIVSFLDNAGVGDKYRYCTFYQMIDTSVKQLRKFNNKSIVSILLENEINNHDKWTWFVFNYQNFLYNSMKKRLAFETDKTFFSDVYEADDRSFFQPIKIHKISIGEVLINGSVYNHENGNLIIGIWEPRDRGFYNVFVYDHEVLTFVKDRSRSIIDELRLSDEFKNNDKRLRSLLNEDFGRSEQVLQITRLFFDYFPQKEKVDFDPKSCKALSLDGKQWKVEADDLYKKDIRYVILMTLGQDGLPSRLEVEEKARYRKILNP